MRKAIVTGATGFVGYWLTKELLNHGIEVIAVVRNNMNKILDLKRLGEIKTVICDISEISKLPQLINDTDIDVFYHLAWTGAGGKDRNNYDIQINNIKASCEAVRVAKELGCKKILFAGTISERLVNSDMLNKKSIAGNDVYAICKHCAHYLTSVEGLRQNIKTVWMQLANLYGPRSINGNIVGYTITELLNGNSPTFGPGEQYYDLLFVEDLAKAAFLLGNNKQAEGIYYIGSGSPLMLKEYLLRIGEYLGMESKIKLGVRPDDGTRYHKEWFSTERLKRDTSFIPSFSFKEGILRTVDWIKQNNNLYGNNF